jgi:hypothetical protein
LPHGAQWDSREEDENLTPQETKMLLRQIAICSSLAILKTASPKVSPFGAAFDRESFRACWRV